MADHPEYYPVPRRLYLANGAVVGEDHQGPKRLLAIAGGTLPWKKAQQYGLVPPDPAPEGEAGAPDETPDTPASAPEAERAVAPPARSKR